MKLLDKFRLMIYPITVGADGCVHVTLFKWHKPWTWRKGIKKNEVWVVMYETEFTEVQ